jgi:hypothetical protein
MTIEDDRQAIADLVRLERFHRDRRRESIHLIAPSEIRVDGDRALEPFYAAADRWPAGEQ